MSASFYASPTIGATTTVAVFFHEIPHEVGDFALLVQSGFSKRAAMGAQFITAIGALLGTLIGIAVQEFGGPGEDAINGMPRNGGLWGTSLVSASGETPATRSSRTNLKIDLGRLAAAVHRRHISLRRHRGRHPGAAGDELGQQDGGAAQDTGAVCCRCVRRGHHALHFVARLDVRTI